MAWTTPRTWASLDALTAALFNTHIRDNLSYLASPPYCNLKSGTTQTLTLASTQYALTFDTEVDDAYGMHVAGNTAAVVAPVAGIYMISAGWQASVTSGQTVRVSIAIAGTTVDDAHVQIGSPIAGVYTPTITRIMRLAASDSVTILALTSQAGLVTAAATGTKAFFQIRWLGP